MRESYVCSITIDLQWNEHELLITISRIKINRTNARLARKESLLQSMHYTRIQDFGIQCEAKLYFRIVFMKNIIVLGYETFNLRLTIFYSKT